MGFRKPAHAPGKDPGPIPGPFKQTKLYNRRPYADGLLWSHAGSSAVALEFIISHELGSAVSVDFLIMILAPPPPPTHAITLPSLQLDSRSLDWCLAGDLCICFYQLANEGSMKIVRVFSNLITGEGKFRHPLHYC